MAEAAARNTDTPAAVQVARPYGALYQMPITQIMNYFQPHGQRRALEAYIKFATGSAWSVSSKMELYEASRAAFASAPAEEGFQSFQVIYDTLRRYWQVFRTSKTDPDTSPWTARDIFNKIRKEFAGYG
jgi:hypothetical protein